MYWPYALLYVVIVVSWHVFSLYKQKTVVNLPAARLATGVSAALLLPLTPFLLELIFARDMPFGSFFGWVLGYVVPTVLLVSMLALLYNSAD